MYQFLQDFKYTFKVMKRRPVITLAAILCLALGIGATSVVFSLVNTVLFRSLPYEKADEIYVVRQIWPSMNLVGVRSSGEEFIDYQQETRTFSSVGGLIPWSFTLTSLQPPQRLQGGRLSASVFETLGVKPLLGRVYTTEEQDNGQRLAVLSYALWQRAFGGDQGILGQTISLADEPFEVVGVMPQDFRGLPLGAEIWVPLVPNRAIPRDLRGVQVFVRLAEGVDLDRAKADLVTLADRFRSDYPDLYPDNFSMILTSLQETLVANVEGRLWAFLGAVLLVLVMACANVANLLLAQATSREKEVALRAAFGAGRLALVRQFLTESVVLAFLGGLSGLVLAHFGLRILTRFHLGSLPRLEEAGLDGRVLFFTLAVTLLAGILFGLAPALRVSGEHLFAVIREGGKTSAGAAHHPLRSALVVVEVLLAVVVLIGTGLVLRSFQSLQNVDPGFRVENLVIMEVTLPRPSYPTPESRVQFFDRLREDLRAVGGGIEGTALAASMPFSGGGLQGTILIEGQNPRDLGPSFNWKPVGPNYFHLLDIQLVEGRVFDERDRSDSALVVVVDEATAESRWPGENAIGKRMKLIGGFNEEWREVIGVVEPTKNSGLDDNLGKIYTPFSQFPGGLVSVAVATRGAPETAARQVRELVAGIDPGQPVSNVRTMEDMVGETLSGPRFNLLLFGFFGLVALVLAAVGVYGVMSYSVVERTAEIGVRRALGARRRDILVLVLRQGLRLALLGLVIGVALAAVLSYAFRQTFAGFLFGVGSSDVTTFVVVPLLLLLTAVLALLIPASRAAQVDPMRALREE